MFQPAKTATPFTSLFTKKDIITTTCISLGYLLLSEILIGFRSDQLVLILLFNVFYYLSFPTRRFILGFSVFIVYWIVFDYMKAFPNYQYNTVRIESLYNAEKYFFGINYKGGILTPNEFWLQNTKTILDVLSGFFYLCCIPVP